MSLLQLLKRNKPQILLSTCCLRGIFQQGYASVKYNGKWHLLVWAVEASDPNSKTVTIRTVSINGVTNCPVCGVRLDKVAAVPYSVGDNPAIDNHIRLGGLGGLEHADVNKEAQQCNSQPEDSAISGS